MPDVDSNLRVVLIGGSSHVGKSTLSEALAARMGWERLSTDSLALHPGRPWKPAPEKHALSRLSVVTVILVQRQPDPCRERALFVWMEDGHMDIRVGRMGADKAYATVQRVEGGIELTVGYQDSVQAALRTVVTREDMIALIGAFETMIETQADSDSPSD